MSTITKNNNEKKKPTNFYFNKLDLDLIKYYCGHFSGFEKAISFLKDFNLKINHLVSDEPCELSIYNIDYNKYYNIDLKLKDGKEKFIPEKNVNEFESILNNLYINYSINNEFFTPHRGFNADQMLMRSSFERFYISEVKVDTFIFDLINIDFKDNEKKKKFLFNMLIFCMKDLDLKKEKKVDFRKFCLNLGQKIFKQCLELNFKVLKDNYLLELFKLSDLDFDSKKNLFKNFYNIDLNNIELINHINDYLLYYCFAEQNSVVLKKYSEKIDINGFKKVLETKIVNKCFSLSKLILDFLIREKIFILKDNNLVTELNIVKEKHFESQLFDYNLPIFTKKNKKFLKHRIDIKKLFRQLKSLDNSRIRSDLKLFDSVFGTDMQAGQRFFYDNQETKNFDKLFKYGCDFSDIDRFTYYPLDSSFLYLFHSELLDEIGFSFYIRKLVFNSLLFRTVILLHISHFYISDQDFVFDNFFIRITKPRSKASI